MADDQYDLEYHRAMKEAYERQAEEQLKMTHHTYAIGVDGKDYRLFLDLKNRLGVSSSKMFHILVRNYG